MGGWWRCCVGVCVMEVLCEWAMEVLCGWVMEVWMEESKSWVRCEIFVSDISL